MRITIIGGTHSGRKIEVPIHARPTSHRAREALISMVHHRIPNVRCVADICAGSGALGLEFLSRGAEHVTFADLKIDTVKANVKTLGFVDRVDYEIFDVRKTWPKDQYIYDVIVMDPPYNLQPIAPVMQHAAQWCEPNHTILCLEQEDGSAPESIKGLELITQKTYGRIHWSLWMRL